MRIVCRCIYKVAAGTDTSSLRTILQVPKALPHDFLCQQIFCTAFLNPSKSSLVVDQLVAKRTTV